MRLVKLIDTEGKELWLNPDAVESLSERDGGTYIWMRGGGDTGSYRVREVPEVVVARLDSPCCIHGVDGLCMTCLRDAIADGMHQ